MKRLGFHESAQPSKALTKGEGRMRLTPRLLSGVLLFLVPAASHAFNVPLPTPDATLNLIFYVQPRFQLTENGAPSGQDPAYDLFVRRTRLQASGSLGKNWLYFAQVDNPFFGRYGNFGLRMVVQDAWVAWGPFGTKGDNVLLLEAGILFFPASRFTIMSAGNYPSIDGHPDMIRGLTASQYPANRTTGVQLRGWGFNKKFGFRGGAFEGVQPNVPGGLNPKHNVALALFTNFDLIGSEEGTYLYQGTLFSKEPVLSVSLAGAYQSQALPTLKGVADHRSLTSTVFLDYPLLDDQELISTLGGYLYGNGTGSKDSGLGLSLDLAYRYHSWRPYISWEYFDSGDCTLAPAQCAQAHTADSRNFRAGVTYYINKGLQHVDLEFALNRGQSVVGPMSVTTATAGYSPIVAPGDPSFTSLSRKPSKTLVMQWTMIF
jgi:hypothetical protein